MQDNLLYNLSGVYGLIAVTGNDAESFLQGQLTCDLAALQIDQTTLGAYCTPKGRILALFTLLRTNNGYLLQAGLRLIPIVLKELCHKARFSKVSIDEASHTYQQYGCFSTHDFHDYAYPLPKPDTRIWIVIPNENLTPLKSTSDLSVWQMHQIEQGIPSIDVETSNHFFPHHINLPALNAVSFKKGCYCGQEIIARMEYRAEIKKNLYYAELKTEATINPGMSLKSTNGQAIARVVNSLKTQDNYKILLELRDTATKESILENDNQSFQVLNLKKC